MKLPAAVRRDESLTVVAVVELLCFFLQYSKGVASKAHVSAMHTFLSVPLINPHLATPPGQITVEAGTGVLTDSQHTCQFETSGM